MADVYVPLLILAVWGALATIYLVWRACGLPKLNGDLSNPASSETTMELDRDDRPST
jgi:hypothetical protein